MGKRKFAGGQKGKSRSIQMTCVMETLNSVQSLSGDGKYVFPDKKGGSKGSIRTAFIKAREKAEPVGRVGNRRDDHQVVDGSCVGDDDYDIYACR